MPKRLYTRTQDQKQLIKILYSVLPNKELAKLLGIGSLKKIRHLAQRMDVKWRAENGASRWREPNQTTSPWPIASRWAT